LIDLVYQSTDLAYHVNPFIGNKDRLHI